jgi:Protein of unknown function (DUF1553)/Protein of unknown function (DUF1549)
MSLGSFRLVVGLFTLTGMMLLAPVAEGSLPTDAQTRAKLIGQPKSLTVEPSVIVLDGPRAALQPVITGRYGDDSLRDLTHFCDITIEDRGVASLDNGRLLLPLKNGSTTLIVRAGGQEVRVPVKVQNADAAQPVSFRHELIAALNVGGCNSGACHGTPSGKNGFKLSLRGYDPAADYLQLTHDVFGRRTDNQDTESSLILLKAMARVPHEGGVRYMAGSVPAKTVQTWLAEGLRDDPATLTTVKSVAVLPGPRQLNDPVRWQQLAVRATFADGNARDVTRLTVFTSSDPNIASVTSDGLVEFSQSGEVAILCRYLDELIAVRLMYLQPKPGFAWSNPPESNYIDKHVFAKLKMLSIQPSELCNDQEFLRRAFMDVCGVLPTAAESKAFLDSTDKNKRAKLIDELLERPEYADQWTLKWADVLRSNRKAIMVKGTHVLQKWLRSHIENNSGFDVVARELLTAGGDTYANPPANFYRVARDPTALAETTAQLFFGIRMQCAKCHNHPFERWTQDDYYSMAAFFARVKQRKDPSDPVTNPKDAAEFIYLDRAGEVIQPRTNQKMPPRFMGGKVPEIAPGKDRREVLAQWLTAPENPFFARSVANRIWFHLLGRGIVDPVDDFRDSNPSANDELLDALAKDFVAHKIDAKYLIRTVMNSRTYQLSSKGNKFNEDDNKYFSHAVTKLHTAEQLFDALCQVTEVPEKFAGFPLGTRAVQLPDGEANHPFLKAFGQPARELACECEREGDSNLGQALQLINGPSVNDRLRKPDNRVGKLLAKKMSNEAMLEDLYLATLNRPPTAAESSVLLRHVAEATDQRRAWEDVHWTLINTKEFLFRH